MYVLLTIRRVENIEKTRKSWESNVLNQIEVWSILFIIIIIIISNIINHKDKDAKEMISYCCSANARTVKVNIINTAIQSLYAFLWKIIRNQG